MQHVSQLKSTQRETYRRVVVTKEYVCNTCRDTGFIIHPDAQGVSRAVRCTCKPLRDLKQASKLFDTANIPPRYAEATLKSYVARTEQQKQAKAKLTHMVTRYPATQGLILMGTPGTGKTHLAVGAMRELIEKKRVACRFVDCVSLMMSMQAAFQQKKTEAGMWQSDDMRPVLETAVLVMDDLGAHRLTPWTQDVMSYLIGERYNQKKVTMITTNWLDPELVRTADDTLEERIGSRLRSRLHEMCDTVLVDGGDYRRQMHGL